MENIFATKEALKENNAWFMVAIEGTTDTSLGATTLTEAIRVAKETRAKMPHLRELTILENDTVVWREQAHPFDIEEAKKTNILVTGQTNCGKTRWACYIASELHKKGWQVIVVDPIGVWKRVSGIPDFEIVTTTNVELPQSSIIYDTSHLLLEQQIQFVSELSRKLWESRIRQESWIKPIELVLEEAELYARSLNSEVAQQLYRLAMSARNYGIRLLCITPRFSNLATELVELSGQVYSGYSNEENSLRKLSITFGKQWQDQFKRLGVGEFIYKCASQKPRKIKVPLFETKYKPQQIFVPKPISAIPEIPAKQTNPAIGQAFIWIMWLAFMAWLLLR